MKKLLQLFLFLIIILISIIFYNYYFSKNKLNNIEKNKETTSLIENENNLIKNLKYSVKFENNSEYNITAELSELVYLDNVETVNMQVVTGKFSDESNIPLIIKSNKAIYNNYTYDTKFIQNITITYLDNVITSDNVDIDFTNNTVTIYNEVVYQGLQGSIKADNVIINLITKNIEVFMNNSTKKVSVISN